MMCRYSLPPTLQSTMSPTLSVDVIGRNRAALPVRVGVALGRQRFERGLVDGCEQLVAALVEPLHCSRVNDGDAFADRAIQLLQREETSVAKLAPQVAWAHRVMASTDSD